MKTVKASLWIIGIVIFLVAGFAFAYLDLTTVLIPVGGILGILVILLIFRRPFWLLLVFVFLIPSEVLLVSSSGATALRYIGIGVAMIWFIHIISIRHKIIFRKRSLWYLLFFAWALLSLLWAPAPEDGFQYAITYLQLALLLVILIDQITSLARLKQIILALAAGGLLTVALFYLVGKFNIYGRLILAPTGGGGVAVYGYPLAFSLTLLGVLGILGKGRWRFVWVAGNLAGLYPLIGAGLRGALLAMMVGVGTAALVVAGRKRYVVIVAVLFLGLLVGAILYLSDTGILPTALINRLTVSSALASGGSNRLIIWRLVLDVASEHPIFGLGLNQFSGYVYRQNLYYAAVGSHNDYLEALVSLGGIGILLLISAELVTVLSLIKARHFVERKNIVWYAVLVGLIIASIVGQNFVNQLMWKYVWIIRAIAIAGSYPGIWYRQTNSAESNEARMNERKSVPEAYHDHRN